MTLNGLPVGRPDGGVSPLVAGVDVSSSTSRRRCPAPGRARCRPARSPSCTFDLRVNDGVPPGTVIANQAIVYTAELPNLLTDGDGNPATGPEPTVVVVGNLQEVRITKAVSVVGGGPALAGATLEYVVQATNVGTLPAYRRRASRRHRGADAGVSHVRRSVVVAERRDDRHHGRRHAADGRLLDDLWRAASRAARSRCVSAPCWMRILAMGTRVTNTGTVYWDNPVRTASASVSIDVGGIVGSRLRQRPRVARRRLRPRATTRTSSRSRAGTSSCS